jgi:hypothetical protein
MPPIVRGVTAIHGRLVDVDGGLNIAVISEGFTLAELPGFGVVAQQLVQAFTTTPPFSTSGARMNIIRVDVESRSSARLITDLSGATPPPPWEIAFGARFNREGIPRYVFGDDLLVRKTIRKDANLPFIDHFVVVVNSLLNGGGAKDGVGWFTLHGTWAQTAVHELGHSAYGLADEYEHSTALPGELPGTYFGAEPAAPNVTANPDRATLRDTIKWKPLLTFGLPMPTTKPSVPPTSCTAFNKPAFGQFPADAVGAYEGAEQRACRIFRPVQSCKMRDHDDPFCPVCARGITTAPNGHFEPVINVFSEVPVPDRRGGSGVDWTHVVLLPATSGPLDSDFVLFYDAASGAFQVSNLDVLQASLASDVVHGVTDSGLQWLVPVVSSTGVQLIGLRLTPPSRLQYRIGLAQGFQPQQVQQVPELPIAPFIVTSFTRGSNTFLLRYQRTSGLMGLEHLNPNGQVGAFPQIPIALEAWEPGWSAIAVVQGNFKDFVLCYDTKSGTAAIREVPSLTGSASTPPIWTASNHLVPGLTHFRSILRGSLPFVIGMSSFTGMGGMYTVRAAGKGLDFLQSIPMPTDVPMQPASAAGPGGGGDAFLLRRSVDLRQLIAYNRVRNVLRVYRVAEIA